jgi:S-DNA-T family DNA segregation ATPase FtsK/SpoIIIE
MRNKVLGEQFAQVDNPDPFAPPVAIPGLPDPGGGDLDRAACPAAGPGGVVRDPASVPVAAGVVAMIWLNGGWPATCGLAISIVVTLAVWRWRFPNSFRLYVTAPVRNRWRWWFYRRRWQPVLTIARLVPTYRGRVLVPVLGAVEASRFADRVTVTLVSGQAPEDFADRADNLAHGFRVHLCRVRTATPGTIVLELVRRDALAQPIPALPIGRCTDLRALPVGRCEGGSPWLLKLHGTHLLVAGATGAGKGLDPVVGGAGDAAAAGGWAGPGVRV